MMKMNKTTYKQCNSTIIGLYRLVTYYKLRYLKIAHHYNTCEPCIVACVYPSGICQCSRVHFERNLLIMNLSSVLNQFMITI